MRAIDPRATVDWSPTCAQLLFTSVDGDGPAGASVYVVDADGSGLRRVGSGFDASWSPDGSSIAIAAGNGEDSSFTLATIAPDGSDRLVLVKTDEIGRLVAGNAK